MNKIMLIIHYRLAISVFEKWLEDGVINEEEFIKIESIIADKYGLSKMSIYR